MTGVGGERKLRHQQQTAADLLQTKVHLAGYIAENAIFEQSCEDSLRIAVVIGGFNAHEYQQTGADFPYGLIVHAHARGCYSLQQSDHRPPEPTIACDSAKIEALYPTTRRLGDIWEKEPHPSLISAIKWG